MRAARIARLRDQRRPRHRATGRLCDHSRVLMRLTSSPDSAERPSNPARVAWRGFGRRDQIDFDLAVSISESFQHRLRPEFLLAANRNIISGAEVVTLSPSTAQNHVSAAAIRLRPRGCRGAGPEGPHPPLSPPECSVRRLGQSRVQPALRPSHQPMDVGTMSGLRAPHAAWCQRPAGQQRLGGNCKTNPRSDPPEGVMSAGVPARPKSQTRHNHQRARRNCRG